MSESASKEATAQSCRPAAPASPIRRRAMSESPASVAAIVLFLALGTSLGIAWEPSHRPPGTVWSPATVANISGGAASAKPLPLDTPGWPPACTYTEFYSVAHREIRTYHASSSGAPITNAMRIELYGWPKACMLEADQWGPDGDPVHCNTTPLHTPLHVLWPGLAVDTMALGVPLGAILLAPAGLRTLIRTVRQRRGVCAACCYPLGTSPVCTECGKPVQRVGMPRA